MIPKSDIIPATSYQGYVDLVKEEDVLKAIRNNTRQFRKFLEKIPRKKIDYAYAEGKWTIKEVLQHIIDTERIFSYRALCFSRGEKKILPGFEQNDYAGASNANSRTWHSLGNEFLILRQSTYLLFNSFTEDMLASEGISNSNTNTVAGWGYAIIGHFYHHKKVIEEKYL